MSDSDSKLHAIVVADGADGIVHAATGTLQANGIPYRTCTDVYEATGYLAGNGAQPVLVVGRLEELGRERGRFFEIIRRNGHTCCCISAGSDVREAALAEALRNTGQPAQPISICAEDSLTEAMDKIIRRSGRISLTRSASRARYTGSEFSASRAEMEALFGL